MLSIFKIRHHNCWICQHPGKQPID